MVNPIILQMADGTEYTLEFSAKSVEHAERRGFNFTDNTKPFVRTCELFFYAFRKNHPHMTRQQTDRILTEDLGGLTDEMLERLNALYTAPFDEIIASEDAGKNSKVTVIL